MISVMIDGPLFGRYKVRASSPGCCMGRMSFYECRMIRCVVSREDVWVDGSFCGCCMVRWVDFKMLYGAV